MSTLTIKKTNAVIAFMNADDKGKAMLKNLFPNENLSGNITDMVQSVDDALAMDGEWTADDQLWLEAVKTCRRVTRVLNGDWKPDYSNNNEPKWRVWMQYDAAARVFRFNAANYGCTNAHAGAGSRHVFKTREHAEHFAKIAEALINKVIN